MLRRILTQFDDYLAGKPIPVEGRSPLWESTRANWVKHNPCCVVTGSRVDVEVHHVIPFHLDPSRELDPTNFATVTRDVHYLLGHLRDWKAYNPNFWDDVKRIKAAITARPYVLPPKD